MPTPAKTTCCNAKKLRINQIVMQKGGHQLDPRDGIEIQGTKIVTSISCPGRFIALDAFAKARWSVVLGNSIPEDGKITGKAEKRYRDAWARFCRWAAERPYQPETASQALRLAHGQPF